MLRGNLTIILGFSLALGACRGDAAPSGQEGEGSVTSASSGSPGGAATATSGSGGAASAGSDPSAVGAPGSPGSTGAPSGAAGQAPPAPPATRDPAANEILERAERAYEQVRSMEADFTQNVYVPLTERTFNSRGKMYHRAPDRFLMKFSDPAGDIIVADGRRVWMYYPSTDARQVTAFQLSDEGQQVDLYREFLSNATTRYAATRIGAETIGGRTTQGLSLLPRASSPYRLVRLWVDDGDSLVRRFEITEENGTVRKIEMSGLRSNVTLADALFQFTPPPGVQVHEF